MKHLQSHSRVEISQRALEHNIRAHRRLIGTKVKLMAVVKSNAYGHGMELVSRVAEASKQVDWLGVASLTEATVLRTAKIRLPILVLSYFRPFDTSEIVNALKQKISFVVYEPGQVRALEQAAQKAHTRARVQLKLDTGLGRLGLMPQQAAKFLQRIVGSPYLILEGVASHLATAESVNQAYVLQQTREFGKFVAEHHKQLGSNPLLHLACSAAITAAPNTRQTMVRLGLGLYGLWPSEENLHMVTKLHPTFSLKPVLTWKTTVVQTKVLSKGASVGYDRSYRVRRFTHLAVLPVGYWEGYARGLSNQGSVLIHGTRAPIIGRICMNVCMVDITDVRNVRAGDEVVLLGKQGKAEITAEEIGKKLKTINYEVITRINPNLERMLV